MTRAWASRRVGLADNSLVMASGSLPTALTLLMGESSPAAGAAALEALPNLDPQARGPALEILLERGDSSTLAALVDRFPDYPGGVQRTVLQHGERLGPAVRAAITSSSVERKARAIALITESHAYPMAYLLAQALRTPDPRTKSAAAAGLLQLTRDWLRAKEDGSDASRAEALGTQAVHLTEALQAVVRHWETHRQPDALRAALWMAGGVESALRKKLRQPRSRIVRAVTRLLEGSSDPHGAGFTLRALAMPELRAAAVRALGRVQTAEYYRALFTESWLLVDPEIERGVRSVRVGSWVENATSVLLELSGPAAAGGARLLVSLGAASGQRIELLHSLLGSGHPQIRRSVICRLIDEESDVAARVLRVAAIRRVDGFARMAERELRRRQGVAANDAAALASPTGPGNGPGQVSAFERYWDSFDDPAPKEQAEGRALLADWGPRTAGFDSWLRSKLAAPFPLDRARALRVVRAAGRAPAMRDVIGRLAHDPEPIVRSLAVGLLAEHRDAAAFRVLRNSAHDPDERVQASAIEALDRLDAPERITCVTPKLASPHSRVRATAVKSLLRAEVPEAGDVLLDMLEGPRAAERLGALWVIERLGLRSARDRLAGLTVSDPDLRVRRRAGQIHRVLGPQSPRRATGALLYGERQGPA